MNESTSGASNENKQGEINRASKRGRKRPRRSGTIREGASAVWT